MRPSLSERRDYVKNFIGHLCTINRHKWLVMKYCFRCGLYAQGMLHDLSKYSYVEFSTGIHYFQGNRSPNGVDRQINGYSSAWLHHKGRNKHHWEYWTDLIHGECIPIRMPINYVVEMFCDRVAATVVYEKERYQNDSALQYFLKNYDNVIMHAETKQLLECMLQTLRDRGMDQTIAWIRSDVLPKGYALLKHA